MNAGEGPTTHRDILVSDFDGTMTRHDFYQLVRARLLPPDQPDFWVDYRAGRLNHFDALASFFSAIRADLPEVLELVADMELDPDVDATLDALDRAGWSVVIASAGCSWYIRHHLGGRLDRVELHANPGRFQPGHGLRMERPTDSRFFSPTVGIDKPAVVRHALATARRVAFAGDGVPDLEAATLVRPELRFARGDLADLLRREGLPFTPFERWSEVARHLLALTS